MYWLLPKGRRRECLFKESCSHYVFALIKSKGLKKGFKALLLRLKQCRPGYYTFKTEDGKEWILLKDKSIIERTISNV